ncbi:hypothetical protein H8F21_14325 [Pseudomonas sp. P66]|uniref:Uncharacterized protein n=1 Tax=Pseudomonas arcuscaelestis TaxID=2710591 RepID=A0ABS2BZ21_9PSED|nr:hypothetical protein [Pseudomonas arcuscaelestis]MBM5458740.1 hypothetical protein [Pseudomonas arcuscaelestis]
MFYEIVKAAYEAGNVRVVPSNPGCGDRITVEADGLIGFKAAFLTNTERQMLAELSKNDAMAVTAGDAVPDPWKGFIK